MDAKTLAILLALVGAASVLFQNIQRPEKVSFQAWKSQYGVKYDSLIEETYRERVFLANLAKIESHNEDSTQSYKMGINQFSALTDEEFAEQYLGLVASEKAMTADSVDHIILGDVDWTSQGAVTSVKDQGQCGSCWAFSTTGALEGLSKLGWGSLQSFSEQQLVDCSGKYGNMACNGGLMDNAFKFVKDNGIVLESEYPYKGVLGTCSKTGGAFKISGYTDITNCNDLANAIVGRPVSVAVDATNWSRYAGGVFSNCATRLNHGVTLVGSTDQYWRIKNSWSAGWGEQGFIRLARGNTCGICNMASYPNK